jgi:hypothetical protein
MTSKASSPSRAGFMDSYCKHGIGPFMFGLRSKLLIPHGA